MTRQSSVLGDDSDQAEEIEQCGPVGGSVRSSRGRATSLLCSGVVLVLVAVCSSVVSVVSGHGIQGAVRASHRALQYENHPFGSTFASSTRLLTTKQDSNNSSSNSNNNCNSDDSFVEIKSQLVPPFEDYDIIENSTTTKYLYSIPTIGSFASSLQGSTSHANTSQTTSTILKHMPQYQPIRLKAFISNNYSKFLSEDQWNILQTSILQPALTAWSDAIHTIPVSNTFTFDTSQLINECTCGSDPISNMLVPQQHLNDGIPNVDTILYVTLGFADDWSLPSSSTTSSTTADGIFTTTQTSFSQTNTTNSTDPTNTLVVIVKNEKELLRLGDDASKIKSSHDTSTLLLDNYTANTSTIEQQQPVMKWPSSNDGDTSTTYRISKYNNSIGIQQELLYNSSTTTTTQVVIPACAFSSTILASAEFCNTDQFDRPTVGVLHLCISNDFFFSGTTDYAAKTVVHEIGHVLGFNSVSMAYLRHAHDGSPRTKRDATGNVPLSTSCPLSNKTMASPIPLPDENTLRFRSTRNGIHVAEIVTETVAMIVRNQFNCPSLFGAELESPSTTTTSTAAILSQQQNNVLITAEEDLVMSSTSSNNNTYDDQQGFCFGSHWSRRLFQSDIMNPIVDHPFSSDSYNSTLLSHFKWMFSPLTLAYFIDSGWYRINPARISNVQHGWGRGAGCDFVDQPCIDPSTGSISKLNQPFYCNQPASITTASVVHGCTEDFSRKATCDLVDYGPESTAAATGNNMNNGCSSDDDSNESTTIPKEYRYFDNAMGDSLTASFIAAMQSKTSATNQQQGYTTSEAAGRTSNSIDINYSSALSTKHIWGGTDSDAEYCPYYRGFSNGLCSSPETAKILKTDEVEVFGNNSRCVAAFTSSQMTGLCMPIACVMSDRSLRMQVNGLWTKCSYAGEIIKLGWFSDASYVVCPDPVRTCPTFWCQQNCLGSPNGVCDYTTGQCMCPMTISATFSSTTTSSANTHNESTASTIQSNITMLPCDSAYDDYNASILSYRHDKPNYGTQNVRMELALSQYYVTDSDVLTNRHQSLFDIARISLSRASPLVAGAIIFGIIVGLLIIGFGICACYLRLFRKVQHEQQRQQQTLQSIFCFKVMRRRHQGRDIHDNDNNNGGNDSVPPTSSSGKDDKAVLSASMLLWLRVSAILRCGNKHQDPRRVRPADQNYLDTDSIGTMSSTTTVEGNSSGTTAVRALDQNYFGYTNSNAATIISSVSDDENQGVRRPPEAGQNYSASNNNNNNNNNRVDEEDQFGLVVPEDENSGHFANKILK